MRYQILVSTIASEVIDVGCSYLFIIKFGPMPLSLIRLKPEQFPLLKKRTNLTQVIHVADTSPHSITHHHLNNKSFFIDPSPWKTETVELLFF